MGKFINRGNEAFKSYLSGEYVDKTELIGFVNSTINTVFKLTCVTRPRRFGKSMAAQMLYAYYDKSADSKQLFSQFKIASDPSFEQHLNKYPAIAIDITGFTTRYAGNKDIVSIIQKAIIKDVAKAYPHIPVEDDADLMDYLLDIAEETGEKFVLIIDEWDALCREAADKPELMNEYVNMLRRLFKNIDTPRVFACVYMTGILPIKQYGTQSALNDFKEFSMAEPGHLAGHIGFTNGEVKLLCDKYDMDYEMLKGWYDGYGFGPGYPAVFNPNSVMEACRRHTFGSYWSRTSAFEALQTYIDLNLDNIREALERIMMGEKLTVRTLRFNFDVKSISDTDELFTLLIHLGYLSYNVEDLTVSIPNKEIRMEFTEAIRGSRSHKELAAIVRMSDELLEATLNRNEVKVARMIEQIHNHQAGPDYYNNEQALRSVVKMGYLSAIDKFVTIQELPTGKGYADMVFIPRKNIGKAAMVVELKWNHAANTAISQIKERDYPDILRGFTDNILLVGITYDDKSKQHSCQIESI
jgi:hypothetical protein